MTGEGLKLSLNGIFFIDAVLSFKSEYVRIKFTEPLRPFVMEGEGEEDTPFSVNATYKNILVLPRDCRCRAVSLFLKRD